MTTVVTSASPHYLLADGAPLSVRATRGGDNWAARQASGGQVGSVDAGPAVLLGMPTLGAPA